MHQSARLPDCYRHTRTHTQPLREVSVILMLPCYPRKQGRTAPCSRHIIQLKLQTYWFLITYWLFKVLKWKLTLCVECVGVLWRKYDIVLPDSGQLATRLSVHYTHLQFTHCFFFERWLIKTHSGPGPSVGNDIMSLSGLHVSQNLS